MLNLILAGALGEAKGLIVLQEHAGCRGPALHTAEYKVSVQVLVDIGAGIGMFSLAAAARGHSVVAFEMADNSLESFKASIAYNGFEKLIHIEEVDFPRTFAECMVKISPLQPQVLVVSKRV